MEKSTFILSGAIQEVKIATLEAVRTDLDNWQTFYLDILTNEKWVKEYPYSYMQAGGPPILRLLDKFPWE